MEKERGLIGLFQDERNSINVTNVSDPGKKEKLVALWEGLLSRP